MMLSFRIRVQQDKVDVRLQRSTECKQKGHVSSQLDIKGPEEMNRTPERKGPV